MTDRRRINGPIGGTTPPVFTSSLDVVAREKRRPHRTRAHNELRKIFLQTGLTPSASGSAYLELQTAPNNTCETLNPPTSNLKITCAVYGPRPLPRSAPFSSNIVLSTHVKYAPFATRQRRGYIRDATERDLAVHLECALKGVIIADRWPKSAVNVIVTILEGEEDGWEGDNLTVGAGKDSGITGGWGVMNVLAGCITASCAALVDARIDCLDLIVGGVAAVVDTSSLKDNVPQDKDKTESTTLPPGLSIVLDPSPPEHTRILAACVVGYMESRDEISELWCRGNIPNIATSAGHSIAMDELIDRAVDCARGANLILKTTIKESSDALIQQTELGTLSATKTSQVLLQDVAM